MSIFDWFKREDDIHDAPLCEQICDPETAKCSCECEHDWFVLDWGEHSRTFNGSSFGSWRRDTHAKEKFYDLFMPIDVSIRKVCLICGECVDTIAEAEAEILAREKNTRDREELAKKMWENCKGVAHD